MKGKFLPAVKDGAFKGLRTARMLLVIIIPIYIAVVLLRHTELFLWIAGKVEPAMRIFGLSGEAVVPLITGVFSDEYSVVAAMSVFALDKAQITIIAMITLCFHSIPVETVITQKIGMPPLKFNLFRLGMAVLTGIVCAYLASAFLGGAAPSFSAGPGAAGGGSVPDAGAFNSGGSVLDAGWAEILPEMGWGALALALNILRVIIPLMIGIELMLAYRLTNALAERLAPFCRLLGIGKDALLPLLVALLLGVTYGVGTISEMNRIRPLPPRDMALLGIFVFSCHGIIETTYLFAVAGGSAFFFSAVRFAIAVAVTAGAARLMRAKSA